MITTLTTNVRLDAESPIGATNYHGRPWQLGLTPNYLLAEKIWFITDVLYEDVRRGLQQLSVTFP